MHDYIVVGAGSAGAVLARRLSEDPACRVLLIEAGPKAHRSLKVRAPLMYQRLWRTHLDWNLYTQPQQHVNGRKMYWPRGKVLGGTSCLNAMVYIRGHRDNYDEWRDLGNPGWGFDDVLPYFKRSEDNSRGASRFHGSGGPLHVADQKVNDVTRAFIEATAKHCGVPVTDDFNGENQEGAGAYQVTIRRGQRGSTAVEFLDPVTSRPNLEIVSEALVSRVLIEDGRARGVSCLFGTREQTFRASKEVILCGGAIGSPQLLLLSGIGAADDLRKLSIDVKRDMPGVGKNLQDHLLVGVIHQTSSQSVHASTLTGALVWTLRYLLRTSGLLAIGPVEAGAFLRSTPEEPRPDIQYHFTPWGAPMPNTDEHQPDPVGRLFSVLPGLIYPKSVGELRLESADPHRLPAIDPRYFSDDRDLAHLVLGVKQAREIAAQSPLAAFVEKEVHPGPDCRSEEQLRAAIRKAVNTIFHPVGTCKMGTDDMAVVDPSLRVRGVEGLRVVDASIMPRIIGGNTNAPTIMIAEKAADLLIEARG